MQDTIRHLSLIFPQNNRESIARIASVAVNISDAVDMMLHENSAKESKGVSALFTYVMI